MRLLFWISLLWIIYTYIGYLAILTFLTRLKRTDYMKDDEFQPKVSLIIAAYNEEKAIEGKIKNCLELDYPKDKLEIIIVSDASSDKTDEIVATYASKEITLLRMDQRRGKTGAQNYAVSRAKGEISVFSDATTIYKKDVIKNLVRNFSDYRVGCVGGEERFIRSGKEIAKEAGFFWKYETLIRQKESDFNTMIGVSGCIFAIRKELYESLEESLIEDFALPLKVASNGFKTVYEKEAICYEKAASDMKAELARKTRIVSGGINVIVKMKYMLNPFKYPLLSFQLISHKIFRWLAPLFMGLLFVSNMAVLNSSIWFFILGMLQVGFYALASAGYILKDYRDAPKPLRLIYHFCIVNLAAIWGIVRFFHEERKVIWETVR